MKNAVVWFKTHDELENLVLDAKDYGAKRIIKIRIFPIGIKEGRQFKDMIKRLKSGGMLLCQKASYITNDANVYTGIFNQVKVRNGRIVVREWDVSYPPVPTEAMQHNLNMVIVMSRGLHTYVQAMKKSNLPDRRNLMDSRYVRKVVSGKPFYGYRIDEKDGTLVQNDEEMAAVEFIRKNMWVTPGRLAKMLDNNFPNAKRGKRWNHITVSRIIKRETMLENLKKVDEYQASLLLAHPRENALAE